MDIKELKKQIISEIYSIQDEQQLEKILEAVQIQTVQIGTVHLLTPAQSESFEKSIKQAENGQTIPREQTMLKVQKWRHTTDS